MSSGHTLAVGVYRLQRKFMPPPVLYVIPVYNAAPYLAESLGSILTQDYAQLRILCIDDGSTDGSWDLLHQLAGGDPRVELRQQANAGPGVIMNAGIARAQELGITYLARMDADDISLPGRTRRQVAYLEAHAEVAAVSCPSTYFLAGNQDVGMSFVHQDPAEVYAEVLHGARGLVQGAAIFRVAALVAVGGYRQEHLPAEDMDLFLRLGERFALANIPDVCYRIRICMGSYSMRSMERTRIYHGYYLHLADRRRAGRPEIPFADYARTVPWWVILDHRRQAQAVILYYRYMTGGSFVWAVLGGLLDPWRVVNRIAKRLAGRR